jgi:hypothetical protein
LSHTPELCLQACTCNLKTDRCQAGKNGGGGEEKQTSSVHSMACAIIGDVLDLSASGRDVGGFCLDLFPPPPHTRVHRATPLLTHNNHTRHLGPTTNRTPQHVEPAALDMGQGIKPRGDPKAASKHTPSECPQAIWSAYLSMYVHEGVKMSRRFSYL